MKVGIRMWWAVFQFGRGRKPEFGFLRSLRRRFFVAVSKSGTSLFVLQRCRTKDLKLLTTKSIVTLQ